MKFEHQSNIIMCYMDLKKYPIIKTNTCLLYKSIYIFFKKCKSFTTRNRKKQKYYDYWFIYTF